MLFFKPEQKLLLFCFRQNESWDIWDNFLLSPLRISHKDTLLVGTFDINGKTSEGLILSLICRVSNRQWRLKE